jgi:hypothetical protein
MELYINTTAKVKTLTEEPQLRGLVSVVIISPTLQKYELYQSSKSIIPKICINGCKNLNININRLTEDVKKLFFNQLPRKVGVIATNHFKDNFRKSGFVNGGVRPWQKTKRQVSNTNGQSGD